MREYKIIKIYRKPRKTEQELNELSKEGWRARFSVSPKNNWIILQRKIKKMEVKQMSEEETIQEEKQEESTEEEQEE